MERTTVGSTYCTYGTATEVSPVTDDERQTRADAEDDNRIVLYRELALEHLGQAATPHQMQTLTYMLFLAVSDLVGEAVRIREALEAEQE